MAQLDSVIVRLQPLTRSRNLAVRFEAEETLITLDGLKRQLGEIRDSFAPEPVYEQRAALAVEAGFLARLRLPRRR